MRYLAMILILPALSLVTACASSANIQRSNPASPLKVSAEATSRPVQYKKIVVDVDRGKDIGSIQIGIACIPDQELFYRGGKTSVDNELFSEAMYDELTRANYEVVDTSDNLFESPDDFKAEYLIAGLVKEMQANICYPYAGFGNWSSSKGEGDMTVTWQIYSRLDRKVVYETETYGSGFVESTMPNAFEEILLRAFSNATRGLLAKQEFHDLLTGQGQQNVIEASLPVTTIASPPESTVPLSADPTRFRRNVVTVFAGGGHGSGFFIDQSGHLLTNEHVVRGAQFVKVKLATGREILGEVSATNSRRDVALVQTERIGVQGLPIRSTEPPIGSDVYAAGSPLDENLDVTISKGVLSAYRVKDGLPFIQSDVNILPGSSGGPLMDDKGNVIGISVSGLVFQNAFAGLNYFIPIKDALQTLQLDTPKMQMINLSN